MNFLEPEMPQPHTEAADPNYYTRPRVPFDQARPSPSLEPLKVRFTRPNYGDVLRSEELERKRLDQTQRQTVRWAIAPGCTMDVPRGRLGGGQEITLADLEGDHECMRRLVQLDLVTEIDADVVAARNPPADQRFFVAGTGGIITNGPRGILIPGQAVSAADFATPADPGRAFEPGTIDPDGSPRAARAAFPARPASDGWHTLLSLVAKGRVRDARPGEPFPPEAHQHAVALGLVGDPGTGSTTAKARR